MKTPADRRSAPGKTDPGTGTCSAAAQNGSEEEIKELEYILKELEGLPGYLPFEEKIEIDASYTDPKLE